jgi:hypothetical protein
MTLAISEVSICNVALVGLGQEPIQSLSEDTKSARLCNAVFGILRNEVQESHPWHFCTKTVEMASVSGATDTLEAWSYLYQAPADMLRPVYIDDWKQEFESRDGYIMCNDEPIKLKYIYENTNPGTWSASFAQCLAWRIKAEIAYAVTQSNTVSELMMKGYLMSLSAARYNSAHHSSPVGPVIDSFLDVRN